MAKPQIRIVRFWTDYAKRKQGGKETLVEVDKVEYCQPGMATKSTTVAEIARLKRIRDDIDDSNPAFAMARMRWEVIEPHYEAWKRGQEIPLEGTPLAVWNGLNAQQSEIIKAFGLRTVEELSEAPDSIITKIMLPGIRDIQANAKRYLETSDRRAVADDLARADEQMKAMAEELKEMRELMALYEQERAEGEQQGKRRGRPPKTEAQDEAAA